MKKTAFAILFLLTIISSSIIVGSAVGDQKSFSALNKINPVAPNQLSSFWITITNDPTTSAGTKLGSIYFLAPDGFTLSANGASAVTSTGKVWGVKIDGNKFSTYATKSTDSIAPTQKIDIKFQMLTPKDAGTYQLKIVGYTRPDYAGDLFPQVSLDVTVKNKATFKVTGLENSPTNLIVLKVDGEPFTLAKMPLTTFYDAYVWQTPIHNGGIRYVFTKEDTSTTNVIVASYDTEYNLTVISSHGTPNPNGSNWYKANTQITALVNTPADESSGTRYRCIGYSGTGSVSSGTDSTVTFNINSPSTIAWNWIAQYKLTLATNPSNIGISNINVFPSSNDGFYDAGIKVTLSAQSPVSIQVSGVPVMYTFSGWSDGSTVTSANPAVFTMNQPKAINGNWGSGFQLSLPPGVNPDSVKTGSSESMNVDLPNHIGPYFTVSIVSYFEGTTTIAFHISLDNLTPEQLQNYQQLKIYMTDAVDFTGDGTVNGNDVNAITKIIQSLPSGQPAPSEIAAIYDINHDGYVNDIDLNIVKDYANGGIVVPGADGGQWRLPWLDITISSEIIGNEVVITGSTDHFSGFGVR